MGPQQCQDKSGFRQAIAEVARYPQNQSELWAKWPPE